jgi:hypothetical protein
MRVRSPIGDLPFRVTAIRRDGRELVIHGELGAWRSEVRVGAGDVKAVAKLAFDGARNRLRR